jgi:hypothetical protein
MASLSVELARDVELNSGVTGSPRRLIPKDIVGFLKKPMLWHITLPRTAARRATIHRFVVGGLRSSPRQALKTLLPIFLPALERGGHLKLDETIRRYCRWVPRRSTFERLSYAWLKALDDWPIAATGNRFASVGAKFRRSLNCEVELCVD